MATAVTDEVGRHDIAEPEISTAAAPWPARLAWLWTIFCLALVIRFLRFAINHP